MEWKNEVNRSNVNERKTLNKTIATKSRKIFLFSPLFLLECLKKKLFSKFFSFLFNSLLLQISYWMSVNKSVSVKMKAILKVFWIKFFAFTKRNEHQIYVDNFCCCYYEHFFYSCLSVFWFRKFRNKKYFNKVKGFVD